MPKYLVLTENDRNIVIEADKFHQDNGSFHFINIRESRSPELVAVVNQHVLAVIEDETAFVADWYDEPEEEEEEDPDDTCLDCRILEFLDSQEGFNAVADIVEGVLGYRDELANEAPSDPPKPEIEHYVNEDKGVEYPEVWGFQTPEGFVHLIRKDSAEEALKQYLSGEKDWEYLDLEGYTKVEEATQ